MNFLFYPIELEKHPFKFDYRTRTEKDFAGFYHWHQCCEILIIHEGHGSVIVNRKTYEIKRGMLFFFQPYQLHKVYAEVSPEQPYIRSVLHFDPVYVAGLLRAFPRRLWLLQHLWQDQSALQGFEIGKEIRQAEWLLEQYKKSSEPSKGASEEEVTLLVAQLLNSFPLSGEDRILQAAMPMAKRPLRYAELIMQWIEEHYTEEVQLETIAEALHLSKYYVSRIFREETGGSLIDYLTARRVKQACRLLQTTTRPIEQIGAEIGYPNASYFTRLFKRVVGTTPLSYRHQMVVTRQ